MARKKGFKQHDCHLSLKMNLYTSVQFKLCSKPCLRLFNSADDDISFGGNLDRMNFRVVLHYSGKNVWLSPVTFKSKCRIDIKYFPFDTQNCKMKFGSWTYDGFRLDVMNESYSADLGNYIDSAEWKLVGAPAKRNVVTYFCCEEPFPDVTYTIIIRRRSLFYMMNLILPLVIITVLINVSFVLPAESGNCMNRVAFLKLSTIICRSSWCFSWFEMFTR